MNETEKWYESRGMWGGVVAIIAGIAGIFGVVVTADEQVEIAGALAALGSIIGGILAWVGRKNATTRIE